MIHENKDEFIKTLGRASKKKGFLLPLIEKDSENLHGLFHSESGNHAEVLPLLFETRNHILDTLRGRTDETNF